jgi:hypothetical protein
VALTLVNRSFDAPETVEVELRDLAFEEAARVRIVTADPSSAMRAIPDIEPARIEEGSEPTKGSILVLSLPPQSFTVIEGDTTGQ